MPCLRCANPGTLSWDMSSRYARVLALSASSRCFVVCLGRRVEHCFLIQKQTAGRDVGPVPRVCRLLLIGLRQCNGIAIACQANSITSYHVVPFSILSRLTSASLAFKMVSLFSSSCLSMTVFWICKGRCSLTMVSVLTSAVMSSLIVLAITRGSSQICQSALGGGG